MTAIKGDGEFRHYPPDGGLKEPVRKWDECLSAFDVIKDAFHMDGYYGCKLPPGGCHCPQDHRAVCKNSHWVNR